MKANRFLQIGLVILWSVFGAFGQQSTNIDPADLARYPTNRVVFMPNTFVFCRPYMAEYQEPFDSSTRLAYCVSMTPKATNVIYYRNIPFNQRFDFHLYDSKGQEVSKTLYGRTNSNPVSSIKTKNAVKELDGGVANGIEYPMFSADQAFVITNKGFYDLSVRLRICIPMTNGVPDYGIIMEGRRFINDHSTNYGVLETPPMHVKIVKR